MQYTDIGIDLGTASILVYIRGKGVVLKEPSVVAFDRDTNKIKAIGEDARLMLGRTPGNIVAVRPLRQGVISDYTVTEKMMKYFIQKALGRKTFRRPRIAVCVPSGVTEVEKKAVEDATYQAGAREVSIIEEPIAAAIGAGIDISRLPQEDQSCAPISRRGRPFIRLRSMCSSETCLVSGTSQIVRTIKNRFRPA